MAAGRRVLRDGEGDGMGMGMRRKKAMEFSLALVVVTAWCAFTQQTVESKAAKWPELHISLGIAIAEQIRYLENKIKKEKEGPTG